MANTIHVDIVSAEGEMFSGEASMVFAPGSLGDLGIAPRHAPLLTTLRPGEVRVQVRGGTEHFIAWSPEPLPRGTSVLVIESRGHRAVDVSSWDDPLAGFPELTDT